MIAFTLSYYLAKGKACISVEGENILIECDYPKLNISSRRVISLSEIRGFEIADTRRGHTDLILYTIRNSAYRFGLNRYKEQASVKKILVLYFPLLSQASNPYFKSYGSALRFAVYKMLVNTTFITVLSAILCLYFPSINNYLFVLIILMSTLAGWWFFIRLSLKKHLFRYNGFSILGGILILMSALIFVPIKIELSKANIKPILLKELNGDQLNSFNVAYSFQNSILEVEKSLKGHEIGTGTSKSKTFPVSHYFLTPFKPTQRSLKFSIWILQEQEQKINKGTSWPATVEMIDRFTHSSLPTFVDRISNNPIFYRLLYRDSQQKSEFYYVRSLIDAQDEVIILEPHWESVSTYKQHLITTALLFFGGILLLNLISCLAIAGYR